MQDLLTRAATAPLAIRPAHPSEAKALTELSLRSKAVWGYDAAFLARCRLVMQVKTEAILAQPHYVAEQDEEILGFYGFEPAEGGIGLDYLFVAPEAIGRGIGTALWNHAVATARGLGHRQLIIVADPNALGFYLRMGARSVGAQGSDLEPGRLLPVLRFPLE